MEVKDPHWSGIDELLFDGKILPAMALYRSYTGLGLRDANIAVDIRVRLLWVTRSGEFRVPRKGYGDGVFT